MTRARTPRKGQVVSTFRIWKGAIRLLRLVAVAHPGGEVRVGLELAVQGEEHVQRLDHVAVHGDVHDVANHLGEGRQVQVDGGVR